MFHGTDLVRELKAALKNLKNAPMTGNPLIVIMIKRMANAILIIFSIKNV
jgi:hypothetical protein